MSNYQEHLKFGWIAHFTMTLILIPTLYLLGNPIGLVFAVTGISLPLTLFASVLPDVDHHSSNTNTLFRFGLFITVVTLVSVTVSQYMLSISLAWMSVFDYIPMALPIGTVVTISLVFGLLSLSLFRFIRPNHRGITHTIPFVVLTTVVVGASFLQFERVFIDSSYSYLISLILSSFFLAGMLTHLKADGEIF